MIPSPKTAMRVSAPPEKRLRKPSTPEDFDAAESCATFEKLTKGTGTLAPNWYRAMMVRVKRTFLRRSGIRKMLARLASMGFLDGAVGRCYRLVRAFPRAGGRPWPNGGGTTVTVPPAEVIVSVADFENAWADTVSLRVRVPPPRTLTRSPLLARPSSTKRGQVDGVALDLLQRADVDRGVGDPEGVGEAAELRDALHQRELAALEAERHRVACALALRASTCGLAALARDAAAHPAPGAGGACRRTEVVDLHDRPFSSFVGPGGDDLDQVGDPREHPTDLGTVG